MIRNIFSRFELDPRTIWEIPVEWNIQNITPDRSRLQDSEREYRLYTTLFKLPFFSASLLALYSLLYRDLLLFSQENSGVDGMVFYSSSPIVK